MRGWGQDLVYGLRMLARTPALTLVAVLTLALGIGLSTAVFSVVAPLISPVLPFENPEQLYLLMGSNRESPVGPLPVSPEQFSEWRKDNTAFESMALFGWAQGFHLGGGDEPEQLRGSRVGVDYFDLLGAKPVLGRVFHSDDDAPGQLLAVVSHRLWQRRFGADPEVLGRAIRLNGESCTVIGVLPEGFDFPGGSELWLPLTAGGAASDQRGPRLMGLARLKTERTPEQAQAQMDSFAARLAEAFPETHADFGVPVVRLRDAIVPSYGMMSWTLFGSVGFVLLIACTNVANLLLTRFAGRRRETTVRAAMGARRARLLRQLLTESALLAAAGAALGMLFSVWSVDAAAALILESAGGMPADSPSALIDGRVLVFAVGVTALTVLLFGLAPALSASKPDLIGVLKAGTVRSGAARSRRFQDALVTVEMALALVLLCGAGLSMQSLLKYRSIDLGFDPAGVYSMRLNLPAHRHQTAGEVRVFSETVLDRLQGTAGVHSAAAVVRLNPERDPATGRSFAIEDQPNAVTAEGNVLAARAVTPAYFETLQIPLLEGRPFDEQEGAGGATATVINQRFARLYFPRGGALGRRIRLGGSDSGQPWLVVVGVVGDTMHPMLDELAVPTVDVYVPLQQPPSRSFEYLVRTAVESNTWPALLRSAVWEVDPEQPVTLPQPLEQTLSRTLRPWEAMTVVMGLFASGALLLGAIGLYSVMSHLVSQRLPEIGLRMALGADGRSVVRSVVSHGMTRAAAGAGIGLTGSFALSRVLEHRLYGVSANDPPTLALATVGMLAVAWLATVLPARRAARVEPIAALRYE